MGSDFYAIDIWCCLVANRTQIQGYPTVDAPWESFVPPAQWSSLNKTSHSACSGLGLPRGEGGYMNARAPVLPAGG